MITLEMDVDNDFSLAYGELIAISCVDLPGNPGGVYGSFTFTVPEGGSVGWHYCPT